MRKHMMITKINGNVHVTVATTGMNLNGWRSYYNITPSSMGRLEKLMNTRSKALKLSATMKGEGTLVSVTRGY